MMEKGRPTYNLESIKESFSSVERLRMTRTARRSAVELGLRASDIIEVIQSLRQADFYKSMNHICGSSPMAGCISRQV